MTAIAIVAATYSSIAIVAATYSSIATTMTSSIRYYERIEKALLQNPKADVVKLMQSLAYQTKCVSYSCYAMSCLACCCCSKCSMACIEEADVGIYWGDTLKVYTGISPEGTRRIFLEGMNTLRTIGERIGRYIQQETTLMNQCSATGNVPGYTKNYLNTAIIKSSYESGEWINKLMNELKNNFNSYNPLETGLSMREYTVSAAEVKLLVAMMGMIYPVTNNLRFTSPLSPPLLLIINQQAIECSV